MVVDTMREEEVGGFNPSMSFPHFLPPALPPVALKAAVAAMQEGASEFNPSLLSSTLAATVSDPIRIGDGSGSCVGGAGQV